MAEGGSKLDVSCSICFEEYDTPKVLTCGHTYCCLCLSKMLDKDSTYLKCPKCRKEVPLPESGKIDDLPTNFDLMAIIDDQSREEKGNNKAFQKEEMHPEKVNQCLSHEKPLEFYCKSCHIQVCTQCLLREHKPGKHDIVTKSDFAENLLVELQKLKEKMKNYKHNENSLGDNIMESKVSLEQQYSELQAQINRKVVQEQEKIKAKGDTLLKQLADKKAANLYLFTTLKTQHSSLASLSKQTEEKCTLLGQEFISFNFSGERELEEISKGIETLNMQIQSLGKSCQKTTTTEVDFNLHDIFEWDLGKLIPTADAERLDHGVSTAYKAAGGTCNQKNVNHDDYQVDYKYVLGGEYDDPADYGGFGAWDEYDDY